MKRLRLVRKVKVAMIMDTKSWELKKRAMLRLTGYLARVDKDSLTYP
jgi:hypothetical protein